MVNRRRHEKGLLTVSSILLLLALLVAISNPAQAYEGSVYHAPPLFWGLLFTSVFINAINLVKSNNRTYMNLSLAFLTFSMLLIVLLPLIRGYWLVGRGDVMWIHGYLKDLNDGYSPFRFIYPAALSLPLITEQITGHDRNIILLVLTPAYFLVFIISSGLLMRVIFSDHSIMTYTMISALMLAPVNLVSTTLKYVPNSISILYSLFVMYVCVLFLESPSKPKAIVIFITLVCSVYLHPQVALALFSVLLCMAVLQHSPIGQFSVTGSDKNPTYTIVAFYGVILVTWLPSHARFDSAVSSFLIRIISPDTFDPTAGREDSLSALGVNLFELGLRLFFSEFMFVTLMSISLLISIQYIFDNGLFDWNNKLSVTKSKANFVLIITISLLPVGGLILAFLIAGETHYYLRFFSMAMALGTPLAGIGLHFSSKFASSITKHKIATIFGAILIFLLLFSASITYYSSPLNYQDSSHVTHAQIEGFSSNFQHHEEEVVMMDLRTSIYRFSVGLEGRVDDPMVQYTGEYRSNRAPDGFDQQTLHDKYNQDRQVITSATDRFLDIEVFEGFRWSEDDFNYLESQEGIHKVYTNGDIKTYHVDGKNSE